MSGPKQKMRPLPAASYAVLIARLTPKQKPALSARKISMCSRSLCCYGKHPLQDFVHGQVRRVNQNGIVGPPQRRERTHAVLAVPVPDLPGDLLQIDIHPLCLQFEIPALSPFLG